jgi:hypothetical protein
VFAPARFERLTRFGGFAFAVNVQAVFGVSISRRLNKRHAPMVVWLEVRLYNASTRETGVRK